MKKLYIDKTETEKVLKEITALQARKNCFVNVSVKPYTGKKFDRKNTVAIAIG